jgi:hypothetical protein
MTEGEVKKTMTYKAEAKSNEVMLGRGSLTGFWSWSVD